MGKSGSLITFTQRAPLLFSGEKILSRNLILNYKSSDRRLRQRRSSSFSLFASPYHSLLLANSLNEILYQYRTDECNIIWIIMTRKSSKHCVRNREPLSCCFDLIRSHQQCIPWSYQLEIEATNTECRVENHTLVRFCDHGNSIYNIYFLYLKKCMMNVRFWWSDN